MRPPPLTGLTTATSNSVPPFATGSTLVLAAGRSAEVVAFEAEVVGLFIEAADLLGVPRSVAAIYGAIFAAPREVSFADLEARLDLSKGSISQGLKLLREVGAVKSVSTPGDRAERFLPDTEMRQLIAHYIESRVERHLQAADQRFSTLDGALEGYAEAEQSVLRARVEKLRRWHSRTKALLPVVRTFLKLGGSSRSSKKA